MPEVLALVHNRQWKLHRFVFIFISCYILNIICLFKNKSYKIGGGGEKKEETENLPSADSFLRRPQ